MIPNKDITFKFFDYKWKVVPNWAAGTQEIYRDWYLKRYGYETLDNLKEFLKDKKCILEAGCGIARDSKMFAELKDDALIVAMDQSENALKAAKEYLAEFKNCEIIRADITNFEYPRKFDFISCDQVIHHTPVPGDTLKHFFDNLNFNGIINFSVCKKKNKIRDSVDEAIFEKAAKMEPRQLWKFAETVTKFGKDLYDLNIEKDGENLQRFVHNNSFRCWYNPDVDYDLCVSSNYDWFSGNPLFNLEEVGEMIKGLNGYYEYKILRIYEDFATINVSIQRVS